MLIVAFICLAGAIASAEERSPSLSRVQSLQTFHYADLWTLDKGGNDSGPASAAWNMQRLGGGFGVGWRGLLLLPSFRLNETRRIGFQYGVGLEAFRLQRERADGEGTERFWESQVQLPLTFGMTLVTGAPTKDGWSGWMFAAQYRPLWLPHRRYDPSWDLNSFGLVVTPLDFKSDAPSMQLSFELHLVRHERPATTQVTVGLGGVWMSPIEERRTSADCEELWCMPEPIGRWRFGHELMLIGAFHRTPPSYDWSPPGFLLLDGAGLSYQVSLEPLKAARAMLIGVRFFAGVDVLFPNSNTSPEVIGSPWFEIPVGFGLETGIGSFLPSRDWSGVLVGLDWAPRLNLSRRLEIEPVAFSAHVTLAHLRAAVSRFQPMLRVTLVPRLLLDDEMRVMLSVGARWL
jgi:hypothetical protein